MEKSYTYKHYENGVYVGVLDPLKVISVFNLTEQINTAGSQIDIEYGVALQDADPSLTYDYLVNELGERIVTDQNERIIVDSTVDIPGIPSLGSRIDVWEYSDDYPDGTRVFNGIVTKWSSGYVDTTTTLTVTSYGVQLDNYLVQIFPGSVLVSNETTDGYEVLYAQATKTPNSVVVAAGQTFTVGTDTSITSITIKLGNFGSFSVSTSVYIYEGTPLAPGALVASVTRNVAPQGYDTDTTFTLSSAGTLHASQQYHFYVINNSTGTLGTNTIVLSVDTTGSFSGGSMYTYNDSTGWAISSYDLGFILESSSGGVGNQYLSTDPGLIVRDLMDNFNALGGEVTYTTSTVETTGTTVSYTFKFNRYLEAIRKSVELAPQDWWWYVRSSDSVLYFKPLPTVVDHTFVLGKHLTDLHLEYSLESVKNTVYFSGGDDGTGANVLVSVNDSTSVDNYGTWLATPADNRVTTEATATTLAESLLYQNKDPRFKTTISIPSTVYDITSIHIGQLVTFSNVNSLVDSLQLQVMERKYTPDRVDLTLDILPPSVSKRIEDIQRNLEKEQTRDNPNT